MSYHVNRIRVATALGAVLLGTYCYVAASRAASGALPPDDAPGWAALMLGFLAAGAGLLVLAMVAFSVAFAVSVAASAQASAGTGAVDPGSLDRTLRNETASDEMNRLIEYRAARIGSAFLGAGLVACLALLAARLPAAAGLNAAFVLGWLGALAGGLASLRQYARGAVHG